MSLIKCEECGKEVSDKAKQCPNCGNPINLLEKHTERYAEHRPKFDFDQMEKDKDNYLDEILDRDVNKLIKSRQKMGIIGPLCSFVIFIIAMAINNGKGVSGLIASLAFFVGIYFIFLLLTSFNKNGIRNKISKEKTKIFYFEKFKPYAIFDIGNDFNPHEIEKVDTFSVEAKDFDEAKDKMILEYLIPNKLDGIINLQSQMNKETKVSSSGKGKHQTINSKTFTSNTLVGTGFRFKS